jgi:xanthine dehydrogenase YagT iron-sulfur-binding subunit
LTENRAWNHDGIPLNRLCGDNMTTNDDKPSGLSRRDFLKISSIAASVPLVAGPNVIEVAGQEVAVHGPGAVPITLSVNGKRFSAALEPRVTLLDTLREHFDVTGPKRVCDRAECGACTVLIDNRLVYSCTTLAIEAQGKEIVTAEGLGGGVRPHPVQSAFVNNDAQQCGFCTPGFTVATKSFLDRNPHGSDAQISHGLAGNLCRCGTYRGIHGVVAQMTGREPKGNAGTSMIAARAAGVRKGDA